MLQIIISCVTLQLLTEVKAKNSLHNILYIFVLGLVSYSLSEIIYKIINLITNFIHFNFGTKLFSFNINLTSINIKGDFIKCLFREYNILNLWNIIFTTLIALVIGILITYIIQNGIIHKWAQKWNISRKFSDTTVWGYIFNSKDLSQWITLRDIKNDLVYQVWLSVFQQKIKIMNYS